MLHGMQNTFVGGKKPVVMEKVTVATNRQKQAKEMFYRMTQYKLIP